MEELLVFAMQFVVEVIVQLCFHFPLEYAAWQRDLSDSPSGCSWFLMSFLGGAAIGGLSIVIAPQLMLPSAAFRVINMVLSPFAVGGLAYWLAQGRKNIGQKINPARFFWLGFAFSLGFTAIRFVFGNR